MCVCILETVYVCGCIGYVYVRVSKVQTCYIYVRFFFFFYCCYVRKIFMYILEENYIKMCVQKFVCVCVCVNLYTYVFFKCMYVIFSCIH